MPLDSHLMVDSRVAPDLAPAGAAMPVRTARKITIRGRSYPLHGISLRDPRLHLSLVLFALHALGQLYLGFELSLAQIAVSILTCVIIEMALVFRTQGVIAWPASAIQTGNSIAFILRVNGTEHGDWWSMHGWYVFAAAAAIAISAKWAIRIKGEAVFNPSNIGIVAALLILGIDRVSPLDYWWGPWSVPIAAAYLVLAVGATLVTRRVGMLPMALAFWITFALGLAVVAATGHCMTARWALEPVCGGSFWWALVSSPETFVFMFFMITDPKTSPRLRRERIIFGAAVALVATLWIAGTQTEFWAKTALLTALTIVCIARFLAPRVWQSISSRQQPTNPTTVAASATGSFVAVAVALAAISSATQLTSLPESHVTVARQEVQIGPLPAVTIADGVNRIAGSFNQERADELGEQLATSLALEAKAMSDADPQALRTAVTGPRLDSGLAAIEQGTGSTEPPSFNSLTAVVVRDPTNHQAIPQLGMHATGTWQGEPLNAVYVMGRHGGWWVVADQRTPAASGLAN